MRNETLRAAYSLTDYDADADEQGQIAYYNAHFSAVSVETVLISIVAVCAAVIENMMDLFRRDVDTTISTERYGHRGWYEEVAKAFQYSGDHDFGLDESTGLYDEPDEEARIVSRASCREYGHGVKLKVAKGDAGNLEPLDSNEKAAFATYINRLKPAGIPVTVVSSAPDVLALQIVVYYDPLVFTQSNAAVTVKAEMEAYLQSIEFAGEYVTQSMVDRLQKVPGIDIVEVGTVKAKHEGYGYEPIEHDARYTPEPGYMVLGDDADLEINLIANQ